MSSADGTLPGMLVRVRRELIGLDDMAYTWDRDDVGALSPRWCFDRELLCMCLANQPSDQEFLGTNWILVVCAHGVGWIQAWWLEVVSDA